MMASESRLVSTVPLLVPTVLRGVKRSRQPDERRNYSPSAIVDITAIDDDNDDDDVIPLSFSSSSSSSSTPAFLNPSSYAIATSSSSSSNQPHQTANATAPATSKPTPPASSFAPQPKSQAEVVDLSIEDEKEDDATLQRQMTTYFRQQREDEEAADDAHHDSWWESELDSDPAFLSFADRGGESTYHRDGPPFIRNDHWVDAQRDRAKRARIQINTDPANFSTSSTLVTTTNPFASSPSSSSIWATAAAATIPAAPPAAAAAATVPPAASLPVPASSSSQPVDLRMSPLDPFVPLIPSFNWSTIRQLQDNNLDAARRIFETIREQSQARMLLQQQQQATVSRPPPVLLRQQQQPPQHIRPCPHNPPCPAVHLHRAPSTSNEIVPARIIPSLGRVVDPSLLRRPIMPGSNLPPSFAPQSDSDEDEFSDSDDDEFDEDEDEDDEEDELDPDRTSLSRAEVDQFPTSIITEKDVARNDECCVCLSGYEVGESVRRLTCLHVMHSACIDQWLQRSTCCPLCKESLLSVR